MTCSGCGWIDEDEAIVPVSITVGRSPAIRAVHFALCDDCEAQLASAVHGLGILTAGELRRDEVPS